MDIYDVLVRKLHIDGGSIYGHSEAVQMIRDMVLDVVASTKVDDKNALDFKLELMNKVNQL